MTRLLALARWLPPLAWAGIVLPALLLGALGAADGAAFWWALPPALWGLVMLLVLASRLERVRRERDDARAQADHDVLTGVNNRAAWWRRLDRALAERAEINAPPPALSLLVFDIDLFKLVNDSLGHRAGDDCLKAVAQTVREELRGNDVLGRIGGEEFAVMLPGARRVNALAVAERIRVAVQTRCRQVGEDVVELTVSIGVAEHLGAHEDSAALVARADRAMYNAKGAGRNIVVGDDALPAIDAEPATPVLR